MKDLTSLSDQTSRCDCVTFFKELKRDAFSQYLDFCELLLPDDDFESYEFIIAGLYCLGYKFSCYR